MTADSLLTASEVARLRELIDRAAITDCLLRYTRGVDRVDPDLVRTVYHPGSWDDHGMVKTSGADFADPDYRRSPDRGPSHHLLGQSAINLVGDEAWVETYFIAHQRNARRMEAVVRGQTDGGTEGEYLSIFVGRYLDRFVKLAGEWRIMERTVVMDWAQETCDSNSHPLLDTFVPSARFPDDPVYHGRP